MITGDIKNQVDRIWDVFWTSGITNPMGVATYRSSAELPEQYRNILPTADELRKLL